MAGEVVQKPASAGVDRALARLGSGTRSLIVTAGVHGNEPDGVEAVRRVAAWIERERLPLAGSFVAFAANRAALASGRRGLDEDLNRLWTDARLSELARREPRTSEEREARELLPLLERELARAAGASIHLDLHTTSGDSPPFALCARRGACQRLALALGAPLVLGLEELVGGTMISWFARRGTPAVVLEGGRSGDARSVEMLESLLWCALAWHGVLATDALPAGARAELARLGLARHLAQHLARVAERVGDLPAEIELAHRHEIPEGEPFRMLPGFANFTPVRAGTLLAHAGPGLAREVRAALDGLLLMPRYQPEGRDGFFLGRGSVRRAGAPATPAAPQAGAIDGCDGLA